MMMDQVEKDAPACLDVLKANIGSSCDKKPQENVVNLSEAFLDGGLNPLDLPFEYLLNGTLPN